MLYCLLCLKRWYKLGLVLSQLTSLGVAVADVMCGVVSSSVTIGLSVEAVGAKSLSLLVHMFLAVVISL